MAKGLILCPPYKALEIPCASKIHNEEVRPHCGKLRKALQLSEICHFAMKYPVHLKFIMRMLGHIVVN